MNKKSINTFIIIPAILILLTSLFYFLRNLYPKKYCEYVSEYSQKYNIDENLIYAIIKCESNFNPDSLSNANAIGLMQITEPTYKWAKLHIKDKETTVNSLYNPAVNINYGCCIFSILQNEFHDTKTTLACYNAGRGRVLKWLSDKQYSEDGIILKYIPYPETDKYVKKITFIKKIYDVIY